jgi:hypothetical protein
VCNRYASKEGTRLTEYDAVKHGNC